MLLEYLVSLQWRSRNCPRLCSSSAYSHNPEERRWPCSEALRSLLYSRPLRWRSNVGFRGGLCMHCNVETAVFQPQLLRSILLQTFFWLFGSSRPSGRCLWTKKKALQWQCSLVSEQGGFPSHVFARPGLDFVVLQSLLEVKYGRR